MRALNIPLRFAQNVIHGFRRRQFPLDVLVTNLVNHGRLATNFTSDRYRIHRSELPLIICSPVNATSVPNGGEFARNEITAYGANLYEARDVARGFAPRARTADESAGEHATGLRRKPPPAMSKPMDGSAPSRIV
jgi:hypothetical protein